MASLSLQSAYQMYLHSYAHTLPGLDDHPKKSESKDTARMLAKLNSNSPTYVSASALASKDSALHLKKITLNLEKSIEPFHKTSESKHMPEQSAYCLDESIADVKYAPEYSTDPESDFSLEVSSLATPQINTGLVLNDASQTLHSGTYQFNLSFKHMNYEFQFDVSSQDTNQSIGEKVARLIRNAHIGIDASMHSTGNNSSFLELKTNQTGIDASEDLIFSISDKSAPGGTGFVHHFGLDYVSQFPRNSVFSIDGQQFASQSNSVTLSNGFLLTLRNTTTAPVLVGLKTDTETIIDHINNYVSSYNKALQDLIDFEPPSSSLHVLADKLANTTLDLRDLLDKLGISILEDHKLGFDPEQFIYTLESSQSESSYSDLVDPLYQLSDRVSETLSKAILDPITFTNSAIASYKNIAKNNFADPYASSAYSGMYFNAYR